MSQANNNNRKILVTSALPYASGSLHLGHLVEHSQSDIWARLMRSLGHEVKYLCADDAHGTPIMLNAEKQGMTPEALVDGIREEHWTDLQGFGVSYDHYHSTHTPENEALVSEIYLKLKDAGHIESKVIEQYFDPEKENPPQTSEQEVFDRLIMVNDGTGYFTGTLPVGLGAGNYKIVYQEFFVCVFVCFVYIVSMALFCTSRARPYC